MASRAERGRFNLPIISFPNRYRKLLQRPGCDNTLEIRQGDGGLAVHPRIEGPVDGAHAARPSGARIS
jgi:hypothetical protein